MNRKIKIDGYIAQRIFNTPLLIEPNKARVISNYLETRMMHGIEKNINSLEDRIGDKPKPQIVEGVSIISIVGTLVQRGGWIDASSGMLSYQVLREQLIEAAQNPKVKSILLEIDSGGGEVEGNFDLARLIRQINDEHKPVVAIANGAAFSGAFSLGVSAGAFFVTETGGVGSVGVIIQHMDVSKNNEMNGIKITNIVAGDRKAELSSDFPLSDSGKELLQKEVNRIGDMFVAIVATMRGISENSVKATQAALLFGGESASIGFVDGVMSFDDLLESMVDSNLNNTTDMKQRMSEMFLKKKSASPDVEKLVEEKIVVEQEEKPVEEKLTVEQEKEISEDDVLNRAAEIAEICHGAGISNMASEFIKSGLSLEDVKVKVDLNKVIVNACILAGKKELAQSYIESGKTLKQIQDDLISKMSDEQKDVSSKPTSETAEADIKTAKNVIEADIERREKINQAKGAK